MEGNTMRKILLATAMLASFAFAPPLGAQDLPINEHLTDAANLPKQGSATYTGTFELSGFRTGTTGDVQVFVDFATGNVSADLTIPALDVGSGAASPPIHYTPTGVITGKNKKASYTLTQGVLFDGTEPGISLSGTFMGPRALNTIGSFDATFCVPEPTCPSGVIRPINGAFSATRAAPRS
jgi:hypothetical protein